MFTPDYRRSAPIPHRGRPTSSLSSAPHLHTAHPDPALHPHHFAELQPLDGLYC